MNEKNNSSIIDYKQKIYSSSEKSYKRYQYFQNSIYQNVYVKLIADDHLIKFLQVCFAFHIFVKMSNEFFEKILITVAKQYLNENFY